MECKLTCGYKRSACPAWVGFFQILLRIGKKKISFHLMSICVMWGTFGAANVLASGNEGINDYNETGFYKLAAGHESDILCRDMSKMVNEDIEKNGKIRFDELPIFTKWKIVESLEPETRKIYYGDIFVQSIDIDNDGDIETVYRNRMFFHGVKSNENLFVFEKNNVPDVFLNGISTKELLKNSDIRVNSIGSKVWRKDPFGWGERPKIFSGQWMFFPFDYEKRIYIAANNYYAPTDVAAKLYLFELVQDGIGKYSLKDKCYMDKILSK